MTTDEKDVVHKLAMAWNAFVELPVVHPHDNVEFCQAIHQAQNIVLARAGLRAYNDEPENEKGVSE